MVDVPWKSLSDWRQALHGFCPGKPNFTEKDYPSLEGKVVIVTGGNTGVGYETVKSLAGSTKAKIYIFSRSKEKTESAIKQIQLEVAKEYNVQREIQFIQTDLSDLTSIKPAVDQFLKLENRLDIIIHNAGVMMPPKGSKTKQGYELQLGTNVIGPHLLQRLLDPIFIQTAESNPPGLSRIVWVTSSAHLNSPRYGLHWDDVNFEKTNVSKMTIYGQSKAANVLQAKQWSKHHNANVISSSICPGYLKSDLSRHVSSAEKLLVKLLTYPTRYGAYTELYAALSPDVKDGDHSISFGVPSHCREDLNNKIAGEKLWDYLNKQTDEFVHL